jgi:hypothetical protein
MHSKRIRVHLLQRIRNTNEKGIMEMLNFQKKNTFTEAPKKAAHRTGK